MQSLGDSFTWPFRDPGWLGKIALQGLILVIPVVGAIAMLGWMLKSLDGLRTGRQEIAPAGFHVARGLPLFGVELIYYAVVYAVYGALFVVGAVVSRGGHGALGAPFFALAYLWQLAAGLLLAFSFPAILLATDRGGFSAGIDLPTVWRLATRDVGKTVLAALVIVVAGAISGLGLIACIVGFLFTTAYAGLLMVGAVSWYEREQTGGAAGMRPATPA